jgi:hypothetical protein
MGKYLFYSYDLKFMHLMVYIISHYLNILKDVTKLTSYIPLDTLTLNPDYKINIIHFINPPHYSIKLCERRGYYSWHIE